MPGGTGCAGAGFRAAIPAPAHKVAGRKVAGRQVAGRRVRRRGRYATASSAARNRPGVRTARGPETGPKKQQGPDGRIRRGPLRGTGSSVARLLRTATVGGPATVSGTAAGGELAVGL